MLTVHGVKQGHDARPEARAVQRYGAFPAPLAERGGGDHGHRHDDSQREDLEKLAEGWRRHNSNKTKLLCCYCCFFLPFLLLF